MKHQDTFEFDLRIIHNSMMDRQEGGFPFSARCLRQVAEHYHMLVRLNELKTKIIVAVSSGEASFDSVSLMMGELKDLEREAFT